MEKFPQRAVNWIEDIPMDGNNKNITHAVRTSNIRGEFATRPTKEIDFLREIYGLISNGIRKTSLVFMRDTSTPCDRTFVRDPRVE